ncbi:amidohydrolase [Bifidobacterium sp. ESL0798]|uniref:M20 metallopeptidase family protein n=1 Tax=Bifidobacterium sp. ESL0798 TaxID=2983235 RepID=UPI0023F7058E|nr:amidohydrolase [Bifidobacterium sp. ESL0798]WEV73465.1 amidohydrolase [Bifidobacterium sp. ESL0798]
MAEHVEISDDLIAVRHHLHQYPELGFKEYETTKFLRDQLTSHGIEVLETPLETGLVAEIKGEKPGPRVVLRADIDGLPIHEHSGLPFSSKNPGVMHGCGHDIHMTGLLAAAFWLSEHRDRIQGTAVILFQPAEETGRGARHVIETGALGKVDALIGTHNTPDHQPGEIAVSRDPMMAGCVSFAVTFHADGTHAGHPDCGTGPIEALASTILSLQTIVSRNISPLRPVVLSITEIHGGDVWNVIPDTAGFLGTVRYFHKDDHKLVVSRFRQVVESTAAAYDITVDIKWDELGAPLVSDAALIGPVAEDLPGYATPVPVITSMGGEDFADFQQLGPLVFASVGSNGRPGHRSIHNPEFVAFDEAIKPTAEFLVNALLRVESELQK